MRLGVKIYGRSHYCLDLQIMNFSTHNYLEFMFFWEN